MRQAVVRRVQWVISIIAAAAFLVGYVLAIVTGIWWPDFGPLILTLVVLGLIVGLLNVTGREIIPYLIAAIALVVVGNFEAFTPLNDFYGGLGDGINEVVRMMAIFTAPAAVVQAIRAGIILARPDGSQGE